MPNYGLIESDTIAYKNGTRPVVYIGEDETECEFVTCTQIQHAAGGECSKAFLRIASDGSQAGPITLNRFEFPWTRGTKIVVAVDGIVRFRGCLMRRVDRGSKDDIIWEAWCDKWLLMQIPIRGALVLDPKQQTVKYVTGVYAHCNPGGAWNCAGANITIDGKTGLYPVFTHVAEVLKTYEAPDEAFSPTLTPNSLTAWTPRRMLQYLRLLTKLGPGDVPGIDVLKWRSLKDCTRLNWLVSANNLIGRDSEQEFDPLDRKLPDMNFRGMRMLGAVTKLLSAAGTHGLYLEYEDDKSLVSFYSKGFSGQLDVNYSATNLRILRGGDANDIDTIYDFELDEDASETVESVLVDGARVHVETPFEYSNNYKNIVPVWTAEEQVAAMAMIAGDGQYAMYPSVQGSTTLDMTADGSNGILAFARRPEAVALMRQHFPHVFVAYAVDSAQASTDGLFGGVDGEFANTNEFPVIGSIGRATSLRQLQFYVGQDGQRLMQRYPPRIQIQRASEWVDVPPGSGFKVDERGWIWIEGHAEEQDGGPFCLYTGSMYGTASDPASCGPNNIRINMAVALDHRVDGYDGVAAADSQFDEALHNQLGGPPLLYIDSPDAYREEIQLSSKPIGGAQFPASNGLYDFLPLTRYVPGGNERSHAQYAAERRLFSERWVKRKSRWAYVGIRPDYRLGQWIGWVRVINGADGDADVEVNAPVEEMIDDFNEQSTTIGGLMSTFSRDAAKGRGGSDVNDVPFTNPQAVNAPPPPQVRL